MSNSSLNTQTQLSTGHGLGRAAGVGYLVMAVTGGFWFGVMQTFRGAGDAALLTHIRDGRLVFELSIVAGVAQFVAYLVTAALLYRRFRPMAPVAATLLFVFVLASLPLSLMAIARQVELLSLVNGSGASAQADPILRSFDILVELSSLFWGLWLMPLALFAFRAGGWSRLAGLVVALSGLGYLVAFVRPLFLADVVFAPLAQDALAALGFATVLGEFVAILWLLLAADRPAKASRAPLAA